MSKTASGPTLAAVDAVVLAGGLGTRLANVLDDLPKILAPVDGEPYIRFLLDWLARTGVRRVIFCLGHLAGKVETWLAQNPSDALCVGAVVEPGPAGTAGALRYAWPMLRGNTVMVMNGDSFVDGDLEAFLADFHATKADASVMCVEMDDVSRYGRVVPDSSGYVERFAEKDPDAKGPGLINAGVYLFTRGFLDAVVASEAASLEREVFATAIPGSIRCFPVNGAFHDIGTPESLAAAAAILAPYRKGDEGSARA
ncbi:MAG: NTP transferase domain-containing protein [Alphaproteobacteria bacterium]|nr:NTP transferase domain-containing protein [Alphaproteobacteria bacterium]